jgi:di/tricarboxylate transporter
MSKFIRLTNFVLNTNDIHKIMIYPTKYCIHIVSKQMIGTTFTNFGFGPGFLCSHTAEVEICKTKHRTDYKIVTDWIDKNQ